MSIEAMQQRFHSLGAEREAILRKSAPATAVREAIRSRIADLEQMASALTAAIKRIEAPLFEVDMERGRLVRALKGKTGEPPPSKVTPMDASELSALIGSMKLNSAVAVNVTDSAKAESDPRIDAAMDAISDLRERLSALSRAPDQSESVKTVYADLKTFAEAIQVHEKAISEIKTDIGVIKDDLGVFVRNLEAKA